MAGAERGVAGATRKRPGPRRAAPPPEALFAALGDGTRLAILHRLCAEGPLSIARIANESAVSRQAVTKHLNVLGRAGLVSHRRLGRETEWRVEPARLDDARAHLDRIASQWDRALGRLERLLAAQ